MCTPSPSCAGELSRQIKLIESDLGFGDILNIFNVSDIVILGYPEYFTAPSLELVAGGGERDASWISKSRALPLNQQCRSTS